MMTIDFVVFIVALSFIFVGFVALLLLVLSMFLYLLFIIYLLCFTLLLRGLEPLGTRTDFVAIAKLTHLFQSDYLLRTKRNSLNRKLQLNNTVEKVF